ncbi:beta-ketoacyl-ACP synthase II [Paenibacillus tengchongensis]|uniref:beta-ketoacyl-ACP synthase II n=1 Tax=Paenibacillus tengchongensis TaxID=2608684 RepID=UPI00124DDCC1|nr:beta-ketoacyl-ACP synthase II [Paenibacillus tengchongensis]
MERVVITGMGLISPLGNTVDDFWRRLAAGESGVGPITAFDTANYKSTIAGQVSGFDAVARFGRKEARRMDLFCQYALAAAEEAWEQSGLQTESLDRERLGVYVGSGVGGIHTLLEQAELLRTRGPERVSPTLIPMMIGNMASSMISMRLGAHGPSMSPVTACSIGNTAIGEAFRLIRFGLADCMIAGGAEAAVTPISLASFSNATSLSTRNAEPHKASRPFDGARDGFVIAEGGAVLILESLTHALRRDAMIYAEVLGYGSSSDAYHMVATHPEGFGAYQAMAMALNEAGLRPADVDVISAHATGTLLGDRSETLAIKRMFGEAAYRIPVTANKSMTGHALGAAGGLEAIALVKSLQEGLIPPTINQEIPDEVCDLDVVPNTARKADISVGISNSFGFGGHNAVIVLRKYEQ